MDKDDTVITDETVSRGLSYLFKSKHLHEYELFVWFQIAEEGRNNPKIRKLLTEYGELSEQLICAQFRLNDIPDAIIDCIDFDTIVEEELEDD